MSYLVASGSRPLQRLVHPNNSAPLTSRPPQQLAPFNNSASSTTPPLQRLVLFDDSAAIKAATVCSTKNGAKCGNNLLSSTPCSSKYRVPSNDSPATKTRPFNLLFSSTPCSLQRKRGHRRIQLGPIKNSFRPRACSLQRGFFNNLFLPRR